jgi:alkylation response protein AidB-like acyl-CoA dehydrogenase
MKFAFNEEQEELRRQARTFLDKHSSSERVRAAMQSDRGYEEDVWRRISAELGWTAITIPERHGGLGLGYVELVALFEEAGRALLCSPLFSTVALATNALLTAADSDRTTELLPSIAAGETTATLAYTEASGSWQPSAVSTTARRDGNEYVLNGVKTFVLDGHSADWLIMAARMPGSSGESGISLFALRADVAGVTRRLLPTMDQTRKLAEVVLDGVRLPVSALIGEEGAAWPALSRTLDLAAIALAAEQVGGAQRCLDMTVAYAKDRRQFGRPIAQLLTTPVGPQQSRSANFLPSRRWRRLIARTLTSTAPPRRSKSTAASVSRGNTTYICTSSVRARARACSAARLTTASS